MVKAIAVFEIRYTHHRSWNCEQVYFEGEELEAKEWLEHQKKYHPVTERIENGVPVYRVKVDY